MKVVVFLSLLGQALSLNQRSEHPERCWMNKELLLNDTQVGTVCPLLSDEKDLKAFCVITLDPKTGISNHRCRRCAWKQNEEGYCQITKHWDRRDCCCSSPLCNRRIYLDAMPGWHKIKPKINNKNKCVSALFEKKPDGKRKWRMSADESGGIATFNHVVCGNNSVIAGGENEEPTECMLYFEVNDSSVDKLEMGCVANHSSCSGKYAGCYDVEGRPGKLCCCKGELCNEKLYRQHGFQRMMNMRYREEVQYLRDVDEAVKQIPKRIWFKDEDYYVRKVIVDGCVIIGTAVYLALITAAYRLYVPMDIEKRPKPRDASKEKISSRETIQKASRDKTEQNTDDEHI